MRDAQIIHELGGIQKHIDNMSYAINTQTQAVSELLMKVQAIVNLCNRSWLLNKVLGLNVAAVHKEMVRINKEDIEIREQQRKQTESEIESKKAQKAKRMQERKKFREQQKKIKRRERQLNKIKKQGGKDGK